MSNTSKTPRSRVAVIGGGVAGLSAAWHLRVNTDNDVHLFEAEEKLGGHAYTTNVNGTDVDIGFMVFNHSNYPNMTKWFEALGVKEEDSDMSLSVSLDEGKTVEWNSDGLNGLFAKRSQMASPAFYTYIQDMLRFNHEAAEILLLPDDDPRKQVTTRQYLKDNGYSNAFGTYYLLPMMAALWSASLEDVLKFPAAQLIGFLCNHKMLQLFDRPQWKTVAGRSVQYTSKVQEVVGESNVHVAFPVASIGKDSDGKYSIKGSDETQIQGGFDQIIFACHPPTAKAILDLSEKDIMDPDLASLLDKIEYEDNVIYVHSDPKLMPKRKRAWASWNCLGKAHYLESLQTSSSAKKGEAFEGAESGFGNTAKEKDHFDHLEGEQGRMKAVYVTYWLNRLQNLDADQDIFVSLNPHQRPDPSLTHKRVILAHPQFNVQTLEARKTLKEYQGLNGLWFAGAWAGYGFHEDGCRSGFEVATALSKVPLPWATEESMVLAPPNLAREQIRLRGSLYGGLSTLYKKLTHDLPVAICKRFLMQFLRQAIVHGKMNLKMNDGTVLSFGDGTPCGSDKKPVTLRVFDEWFFVKTALEYDLGLARSYMAGHFKVEPLEDKKDYHPVLNPENEKEETTMTIGDPVGLTRLFLLIIGNRDRILETHVPRKAGKGSYSNAMTNASGLFISKIGSFINYLRYKMTMDNSEKGGSLKNIHAHYDLSNDLFRIFLDKETLMYSCAVYDAIKAPSPYRGLVFRGSLEEAQNRKLDTYLARAQVQPGQKLLDIGFGWGGLSLRAATKYGCKVTGITLSVEQKALAEERVKEAGVGHLVTFEVCDYRTFCRRKENLGKFDRIVSCEMIEAVGHEHLGEFFWAVEQVLAQDGILVMGAITTPEQRYETYIRSTDFINTIIFPGSCCPSLHALVDAAYKNSCLTLEHIDNIGLHYAQTLQDWRRRFNAGEDKVRELGFDDVFIRAWNYYLTYCESGFFSQTENMLILVFSRQGNRSLVPLCESRSVTQAKSLTESEIKDFMEEA